MTYFSRSSFRSAVAASRSASDASGVFNEAEKDSAAVPERESSPTDGRSIPIVVGAVKMTGDIIWIHTFRNSKNECLCHIAVCFGRNTFGRTLGLVSLQQNGNYIYRRSKGEVVDPPKAVRFYDGTQTEADPKIKSIEGASKVPAFKGYIYAVLESVKLGDISAEFSDATLEQSVSTSNNCDPVLSGVDLVYDQWTGLYYGLLYPMSGFSRIIVSDGCRVLSNSKIYSPFDSEYDRTNTFPPGGYPYYCDRIYPLHCQGLVVITGFTEDWSAAGPVTGEPTGMTYSPVFNPYTGRMVHKSTWSGTMSYVPWNGLGKASIWTSTNPEATDIEWKISYRLPGEQNRVAYLRLFDRDDCIGLHPDFSLPLVEDGPVVLGAGNIACQVVQITTGNVDNWIQDIGRVQQSSTNPFKDKIDDWNVRGAPLVDDLVLCEFQSGGVTIAGLKKGPDNQFTVYVMRHSISGLSVEVTVNVDLPDPTGLGDSGGWEADDFNYDASANLILVSASSHEVYESGDPVETVLEPRVYQISLSGMVSYVVMATGYTVMFPQSRGPSTEGFVPVASSDYSKVGKLELSTGDTTDLYEGVAPDSPPVVDLQRQTFGLPSVTGLTNYSVSQVELEEIPLVSLLTDCCAVKGYDSADLVFQNLGSYTVLGLLINSTIRLSDLFNRLGALYGFNFVETDRKLKFLKKRNGGSIAVDAYLTEDDLVMSDDDAGLRNIQRGSAGNLLGGMDLEFVNPQKQFENDTLKIRRPVGLFDTGASSRIETLSLPITITSDQANELLYESFYASIRKESRFSITVLPWRARVEPGDCLSVTVDGVTMVGVATRVVLREDFAQEIELESYLESGSTSLSPVDPDPVTVVVDKVYGEYVHLDIPYLSVADVAGPLKIMQYGALTALTNSGWSGADLYRSVDGTAFGKIAEYDFSPATVGTATNALSYPELDFATDTTSVLTITVDRGDPSDFSSVSYLEQMNGQTLAAYGRPGAWEIISWRDAVENSDGTVSLSNLQRGLYGSNKIYASSVIYGEDRNHQVGDLVVVLDPIRIVRMSRAFSEIGLIDRYAVATNSVGLDTATKGWFSLSGRSNKIPPIANLQAVHVSGESTMTISWDQISQVPGDWRDNGAENPPLEPITYVLKIFGWSGTVYADTTETTFVWEDYGTDSDPNANAEENEIYVEVFQLSASDPYTGDYYSIASYKTPVMGVYAREAY